MAGYEITLNKDGGAAVCRLEFGQINAANYRIYRFDPGSNTPVLLASSTMTGGATTEHDLGPAATLDGVGITISARIISPLINPTGPADNASLTVSFRQVGGEADGSPRTINMPLNSGVAAFDVGFIISAE